MVGLEVHVQLRTRSKIFCADAAEYGAPPNTHVCPVCLGMPGALPVLNREAVEQGVRAALGLACEVHQWSAFARKHYFYPDLPKGYQITQHDRPLATGGYLDVPGTGGSEPRRIRIRRVHLEEDTGKSLHDSASGVSLVDFNRAGVPLVEIVTEPDLASAAEARAFLTRLKQLLEHLGVSDCNMEEGTLRVDANVSLGRDGRNGGTRTELKNINSFSNVERAIRFELERQAVVLDGGGRVERETLSWDAAAGVARRLRSKEELHDYRYFEEPDLSPLCVDGGWVRAIREALPEMPWSRRERFVREYGLSAQHAEVLTAGRALADYFEELVREGADAREGAVWLLGEVLSTLHARNRSVEDLAVSPAAMADLLSMLASGEITRAIARRVWERMVETGDPAPDIVRRERMAPVRDEAKVEEWVAEVLRANPVAVARFRAGEDRLMHFFVGQVMRLSGGRADSGRVRSLLHDSLNE